MHQAWTKVDKLPTLINYDINIDLADQFNHDQEWYIKLDQAWYQHWFSWPAEPWSSMIHQPWSSMSDINIDLADQLNHDQAWYINLDQVWYINLDQVWYQHWFSWPAQTWSSMISSILINQDRFLPCTFEIGGLDWQRIFFDSVFFQFAIVSIANDL